MKHHNRLTCRDACCSHRGQQPDPPEEDMPERYESLQTEPAYVPKLGDRKNTGDDVLYGFVDITFDLTDDASRPLDVEVRFSVDHGETFRNCTPAPGSPSLRGMSSCPHGTRQVYTWNTVADLGLDGAYEDVLVMVIAGGRGGCVMSPVRIDNTLMDEDE